MRVLIIGGTGFTAPRTVQLLLEHGHEVTVFHRGKTVDQRVNGANEIVGDRNSLRTYRVAFKALNPDVVLDTILYTKKETTSFMEVMENVTPRVVALSSGDVYRAFGVLWKKEKCGIQPMPLREGSPLRLELELTGQKYDKRAVEHHVMRHPSISGTILRLPAIYGPKDSRHRLFRYLKRMGDGRPAIILEEGLAEWRHSRGYVDNISHAIFLAVTNRNAAGKIYNVAEPGAHSEADWVGKIAAITGWDGKIVRLPFNSIPEHLRPDNDIRQDIVLDSIRIRAELGYAETVPEEEALRKTIEWETANPPAEIDPKEFDYEAEDKVL